MKLVLLLSLFSTISISSYSQAELTKNVPPISMLPKDGEVKQIYELPVSTDYRIYNSTGQLVLESTGQFIEYTKFKKGVYFVRFEGKSESFKKD